MRVPGPRAVGDALRAEQDGLDVRRVGDADDNDLGVGDGRGGGLGHGDAQIRELGGTTRRAVPARDREAGPGEVGRHGRTHRAETEEGDAPSFWRRFSGHAGFDASGGGGGSVGGVPSGDGASAAAASSPGSAATAPAAAAAAGSGVGVSGFPLPRATRNAATAPAIATRRISGSSPPSPPRPVSIGALGAGVGTGVALGTGVETWRDDHLHPCLRVALGDDRDAGGVAPDPGRVAHFGGHDIVRGRLDVGDRIRDGERDRQALVDASCTSIPSESPVDGSTRTVTP